MLLKCRSLYFLLFIPFTLSCNTPSNDTVELHTKLDSLSYALGVDIASHYYENQQLALKPELVYAGFKDMAEGGEPKMADSEIEKVIKEYEEKLNETYQEDLERIARENEAVGREFLKKNKSQENIVELQSGLQYKVLKEGKGDSPMLTDIVHLDFEGKLLDGVVFSERGERDIVLVNAIPGLQEALLQMKAGSHWEIYVPPHLGWGTQDREIVKPNSLLIFDMQMISIL